MSLEHRDYYREKKPDWDNIKFPKKSKSGFRFTFWGAVLVVALTSAFWFYLNVFPSLVPSLPLRSIPQDQSALVPVTHYYKTCEEYNLALSRDYPFLPSTPCPSVPVGMEKSKESPVVHSVPAGYQGYIEVNGVKKEIYSKAVVSETYHYRSVSNVKFIPVKINGIEFDMMIDTGASSVSLNLDAVKKLGITKFADKGISNTAGGSVLSYYFPCSITLGSFEVSNIQCSYNAENTSFNLLGGSFLKNFNYSINESENTITLSLR
jgi:clan AA aspartic protease (TIGR02281 family)